jgi:hypothetical protein
VRGSLASQRPKRDTAPPVAEEAHTTKGAAAARRALLAYAVASFRASSGTYIGERGYVDPSTAPEVHELAERGLPRASVEGQLVPRP